ncbi:hypothetical protein D2962_04450 [Biomaibacter acetigenes]|uniref:Uncharacterized protein n=1 Tax=Biomaibacter acetigenes TaxID=2316383 RepID=A0A3G2R3I2_9FIRM|nr:hypothetical protein [Biomaibacter acetigenes]AYO29952.1 hypothetical protein D2962_04450 [Biomaibacter acetigenes]
MFRSFEACREFARAGKPVGEAVELINELSAEFKIFVLTSDTYGTAGQLKTQLRAEIHIIQDAEEKKGIRRQSQVRYCGRNIREALELFKYPERLKATLRR